MPSVRDFGRDAVVPSIDGREALRRLAVLLHCQRHFLTLQSAGHSRTRSPPTPAPGPGPSTVRPLARDATSGSSTTLPELPRTSWRPQPPGPAHTCTLVHA